MYSRELVPPTLNLLPNALDSMFNTRFSHKKDTILHTHIIQMNYTNNKHNKNNNNDNKQPEENIKEIFFFLL